MALFLGPRRVIGLTTGKGGRVQARQWLIGGYAVKIGAHNILFS